MRLGPAFHATIAAFAVLGGFAAAKMRVTTDITHFLPAGEARDEAALSRALADTPLSRTRVLLISGESAIPAAKALARAVRENPEVAWVRHGVEPEIELAFHEVYFPARFSFLSEDPERELDARLSDAGLAAAARELKARLAGPDGPLLARVASSDPLGAFASHMRRAESARDGEILVDDGQLVTNDGAAVIFLATASPPMRTHRQRPLQDAIEAGFARVDAEHGGELVLEQSGVARYALATEASVRSDIARISILSTIGGVLLFALLFRSLRNLLLLFVPLAAGMIGGIAAVLLLFGEVHGITLAFGASLIGVAIDYPIHLFNEHALRPDEGGPAATLSRIWRGILLGGLTTIAGFAGMAWTTFPGIREIAVFAPAGILAALAATRWLVPPLMSREPARPTRLHAAASAALGAALSRMKERRGVLLALPALAITLCAFGLPRMRWIDDPRALTAGDEAIAAEDARVRARITRMDGGRFVISSGPDEERALARNDRVHEMLVAARDAGEIEGWRSLHALVWSAELQRKNVERVYGDHALGTRTAVAFEREGFRAGALAPFQKALLAGAPSPLTLAALRDSPLAPLIVPFQAEIGGEVALLTFLRGVHAPDALAARFSSVDGVRYFDQPAFLHDTYARFRARTFQLAAAGLVAVLALVFARYRRWRPALAAFLPALLAAATTTAALAAFGVELNLLHLVGLLLVLSMGVDYSIFVVEARERGEHVESALLGTAIACATTILSFGLMGMSSSAALQGIGITTALGSVMSLVLAPTTLLLLGDST